MLGHPRGLFILFMTEMWERMSFYGMKALLILYMINYLIWNQEHASHVMMIYTGSVYLTPLLGGLLADKVFGARWSVVIGGVLMCIGHFLLAFEPLPFFYSGLGFLIAGCGMLKPNISTQVGSLYSPEDHRRDSAFTLFYMGINLGAFIGPVICGWLRLNYGFHYGFAAAGVGMALGLIVYLLGMGSVTRRAKEVLEQTASQTTGENGETKSGSSDIPMKVVIDRIIVLCIIFVFVIVFWMAFEQGANVMTVWADKHTNLHVFESQPLQPEVLEAGVVPATQSAGKEPFFLGPEFLQSVNPFFIITLAGVFAWLWIWLDKRNWQPSTPAKMTMGMFGMVIAYGVMLLAVQTESGKTSAPLAMLPAGIEVQEDGTLYTLADGQPVYYGCKRLRWNDEAQELTMTGVLNDLDWLKMLGATAPENYRKAVEELDTAANEKDQAAREKTGDEKWVAEISIPEDVPEVSPVMTLADTISLDDPGVLSTSNVISEKDRLILLAAASESGFRSALNKIYKESSSLKVSVMWLILFYLLITMSELCLSPVGLSLVTKMAPPRWVGFFMGMWFVTTGGLANLLAHFIGGYWGKLEPTEYFMIFGGVAFVTAVIMLLMVSFLKKRMHGIQ